jgi:CobQ-like glutamine amidotransferase family enzyme
MEVKSITIAHLYPREMNIYGDMGNIRTFLKRLEWRGLHGEVMNVEPGSDADLAQADLVFGGGGQDSGQLLVADDLLKRGPQLRALADDGVPMLMICGLYQLFGKGFITADGTSIPGIGVFHATTTGGSIRMIGNIAVDSPFGLLAGFENHSGQTVLGATQRALGKVIKGYGNNPTSGYEGAMVRNAIGTYMHGPLLPKNPGLADHLLGLAWRRSYNEELPDLADNELEKLAWSASLDRPQ